jgi:hypothetical protein
MLKKIIKVSLGFGGAIAFALIAQQAYAALTIGATSVVSDGALTVTGAASSVWDLGASHTLSLQTTGNGQILTGTGTTTLGGSLIVGATTTDTTILKTRLTTGTAAGSFIELNATNPYAQANYLGYALNSWSGIGDGPFEGLYLSPRVKTANQTGSVRGLEVNTSNGLVDGVGVALGQMEGVYIETQVKPIAASTTVGPIYGIESQISLYTPTSGTLTLATTTTDSVGVAAGRFQLGLPASGLKYWTSVYGVLIQTNGGPTQTLGSGLLMRNFPSEGVQTWTKGIQITSPAVTGISLEGAMTTGISIAGAATNDIRLQGGATITNASSVITISTSTTIQGALVVSGGTATLATTSVTGTLGVTATTTTGTLATASPCYSKTDPAVCVAAASGSFVVAAGATTANASTTAVTANSQIILTVDSSLGSKLTVTCNTTIPTSTPVVTIRTPGNGFQVSTALGPITNPLCISYLIIN